MKFVKVHTFNIFKKLKSIWEDYFSISILLRYFFKGHSHRSQTRFHPKNLYAQKLRSSHAHACKLTE